MLEACASKAEILWGPVSSILIYLGQLAIRIGWIQFVHEDMPNDYSAA